MFRITTLFFLFPAATLLVQAQPQMPWRLEAGALFSHFQQQIKAEVGGEAGDRLVDETALGLLATASYSPVEFLSAGIFLRYDVGERNAARFSGFDSLGRTTVQDHVGGAYSEFWAGPFVRVSWKLLSADLGYGLIGLRKDDARSDIPSVTGDTTGAFTTHPTIAWMAALGGAFPVTDELDLFIRIEYRIRYYNRRGGELLVDEVEHGTQSVAPLVGIGWRF